MPWLVFDGMTVKERVREAAISVVESDFADEHETIAGLKKRKRPPKPPARKLRRRSKTTP
jgi:hypothetical protein